MRKDRDYIWAIFLIFVGIIFLLNTTGVLNWNVWLHILSYWPVFLILGGIRLILGKSLLSTIILSVLAFLIFVWIGISAYINNRDVSQTFFRHFPVIEYSMPSTEAITKEFSVEDQNYENVETLNYQFDFGVSKFNITDTSEKYLNINATYNDMYGEPQITENLKDGVLNIDTKEKRSNGFGFINFKTPEYDISLGSKLISDISIDNGVGNGTLVFNKQQIKNLNVKTGTGEVDIELGYDSIPTEELKLDIGTGNVKLAIPSTVGYVITYDLGVGQINLNGRQISGIGHDGSEVRSENYDTAERILRITADVGVGQLDINFN